MSEILPHHAYFFNVENCRFHSIPFPIMLTREKEDQALHFFHAI